MWFIGFVCGAIASVGAFVIYLWVLGKELVGDE